MLCYTPNKFVITEAVTQSQGRHRAVGPEVAEITDATDITMEAAVAAPVAHTDDSVRVAPTGLPAWTRLEACRRSPAPLAFHAARALPISVASLGGEEYQRVGKVHMSFF